MWNRSKSAVSSLFHSAKASSHARKRLYVKLHLDVCYRTMREAAFDGDRGESISLAIVDNDAITLYALRKLIENTPTLTILWTSETGQEALTHCKNKHLPDVLLVDMALSECREPCSAVGSEPPVPRRAYSRSPRIHWICMPRMRLRQESRESSRKTIS